MALAAYQLDRRFEEVQPLLKQLARPQRGWVKAIREGLGMTTSQLAHRLGIRQPSLTELEKAEAEKRITLATLERAAEALDCRLVYILVPNQPLSDRLAARADEVAEEHLAAVDQTMRLERQGVTDAKRRDAMKKKIIATLLQRPSRLWQTR